MRKCRHILVLILAVISSAGTGFAARRAGTAAAAGGSGILSLNPESKVLPLLLSARSVSERYGGGPALQSVTFLHFSDLHGSVENLGRIVEFRNAWSPYIDDAVHTGDAVVCYMDNPNPWKQVSGAENIINLIGNHDCWKGHKTWAETAVPYDATKEDVYGIFIKPFVSRWNVVQPSGVGDKSSPDHCACYFHKDYPAAKLRFIALDSIHYDSAQDSWFASVLDDAARKGYAVIAAQHYFSQTGLRSLDSGFSSGPGIPACTNPDLPQIECMREQAFITLDRFIDAGGVFVCWMSGHDHEDYIGVIPGHERQLQILVDKAGEKDGYMHEDRTRGTVNQDSFNLLTVNRSKDLMTIQRIGCTRGPRMRAKTVFCYDYKSRKVIVNE